MVQFGSVVIGGADSLLVETHMSFPETFGGTADFALVRTVANSKPPRIDTVKDRSVAELRLVFGMLFEVLSFCCHCLDIFKGDECVLPDCDQSLFG